MDALGKLFYWLAWPGIYLALRNSQRTRVAIVAQGKWLLVVKPRLGSGFWGLPGGGVKPGEQVAAAAIREVCEETGLNLELSQLRPVGAAANVVERGVPLKLHYFRADIDEKRSLGRPSLEIAGLEWIELKDADLESLGCSWLNA